MANEAHTRTSLPPQGALSPVLPVHGLGTSAESAEEAWALWDRQWVCPELGKWLPQSPATQLAPGQADSPAADTDLSCGQSGLGLQQHWQWPVLEGTPGALRMQGEF